MTLLAFQFGMQPILAREYNSKDLVKTSLVLSIEVSRKEYIRNIYSESDSRKVLATYLSKIWGHLLPSGGIQTRQLRCVRGVLASVGRFRAFPHTSFSQ